MFLPEYFILFDAVVNGTVSLISLSILLLLVYRNLIDFCVLILYPVAFPNLLFSSRSFLVASLGFSTYNIMSSVNSDSLMSFFQFGLSFLLFLF